MDFPCSFATSSPSIARSEYAKTLRLRNDFEGFSYLRLERFFRFVSGFPLQRGFRKRKSLWSDFLRVALPKSDEQSIKNGTKKQPKSSSELMQIWLHLGHTFLQLFNGFGRLCWVGFPAILAPKTCDRAVGIVSVAFFQILNLVISQNQQTKI